MGVARVIRFSSSPAGFHRRRRAPATTQNAVNINQLVNDLQILALERPYAVIWISELAHRLSRQWRPSGPESVAEIETAHARR